MVWFFCCFRLYECEKNGDNQYCEEADGTVCFTAIQITENIPEQRKLDPPITTDLHYPHLLFKFIDLVFFLMKNYKCTVQVFLEEIY